MKNNHRGFTLIELMVVIAIIGVVFGVVISSANQLRKNSRDGQRKSDLSRIQGALQNYYGDVSNYPASLAVNGSISNGSISYLNPIPTDPNYPAATTYCYVALTGPNGVACDNTSGTPASRCNYYIIYANLENNTGNSYPSACNNTTYNYQVTSP